jgi:hypothetical protein
MIPFVYCTVYSMISRCISFVRAITPSTPLLDRGRSRCVVPDMNTAAEILADVGSRIRELGLAITANQRAMERNRSEATRRQCVRRIEEAQAELDEIDAFLATAQAMRQAHV